MPPKLPENLPLSETASLATRRECALGIAVNGKIAFVFPRGTPFAKVTAVAETVKGVIYLVDCEISYRILDTNRYYDHSPKVSI